VGRYCRGLANGTVCFASRFPGATYDFFFFYSAGAHGRCSSMNTNPHVVHAWWGSSSFPCCCTTPVSSFWWKVGRSRWAHSMALMLTGPQSGELFSGGVWHVCFMLLESVMSRSRSRAWRILVKQLERKQKFFNGALCQALTGNGQTAYWALAALIHSDSFKMC
jgi:hypothetical protein